MIDTVKIKTNILSCAFKGALVKYSEDKVNIAISELHKKAKKYVPVTEDEYLVEAPERWQWSRLGYVTRNHGQREPQEDFCYIDVGTLDNVNHCLAKKENLVDKENAPSRARKIVEQGDVLYSTVRPYLHNICIINKGFSRIPVASTAFCVMAVEKEVVINKFLFYWLLSAEFDKFSNGNPSKGTLYPAIGEKDLLNGVIPIPSIEEQELIVEKIDRAFECLDKLNILQQQYSSDLEILKAKIIDAGIQGKLTEQLPEDGTAEELLKQIVEEKKQLIKEKKMKKERDLPAVDDKDKDIDIPQNWEWVRLGDISQIFGGKRIPAGRSLTTDDTGHKYIRVSEMKNRTVIIDSLMYVPEDIYPSISRYIINKEDVYITVAGTIGRVGTIPDEIDGANLTENADRVVFNHLNKNWLVACLDSSFVQKQIAMVTTQVAQPKLSIKRIEELIIPLPPLLEQERIAEKIEKTLELL